MPSTAVMYEQIRRSATASVISVRMLDVAEDEPALNEAAVSRLPQWHEYFPTIAGQQTIACCTRAIWSRPLMGEPHDVCSGDSAQGLSWERTYVPRTELGKKLLAIRIEAIREGLKLLTEDEVLEEIRRRREPTRNDDDQDDTDLR